jgi:pyruvate/2-oxoglutarate dehydrogenase complex dihydrolipoamide acyltransferase (E2) component
MRVPPILTFIAATIALSGAQAQSIAPPTGTKSLAATLNVYAFPGAGQASTQQAQDESDCYKWAEQETGNDPFQLDRQAAQQQQQAAQQAQQAQQVTAGASAKGALGGAAGGAAIGAGVGLLANRARTQSKAQQSQQQAQQSQAAAKATTAQITDFKKAFSACLEAKKYTVKF